MGYLPCLVLGSSAIPYLLEHFVLSSIFRLTTNSQDSDRFMFWLDKKKARKEKEVKEANEKKEIRN